MISSALYHFFSSNGYPFHLTIYCNFFHHPLHCDFIMNLTSHSLFPSMMIAGGSAISSIWNGNLGSIHHFNTDLLNTLWMLTHEVGILSL
jgi:hypothetical protein